MNKYPVNETTFTNMYMNNPQNPSAPPFAQYPNLHHMGQSQSPNRYAQELGPPLPVHRPTGKKKKIMGFQRPQFLIAIAFTILILLLLILIIVVLTEVLKLKDEINDLEKNQVTNEIILNNNHTEIIELTELENNMQNLSDNVQSLNENLQLVASQLIFWPSTCNNRSSSATQTIYPPGLGKWITVQCDLTTDGGGWMIFQKRSSTAVNFDVSYNSYVNGFGDASSGDYWLGLETLHSMTQNRNYELRIEVEDWCSSTRYAVYSTFKVGNSANNYQLTVSGYSGNAGDSLRYSNGYRFTTTTYCPYKDGGWWFRGYSCSYANLNGKYYSYSSSYCSYYNTISVSNGIFWQSYKGSSYSFKSAEMKIRLI